MEPEKLKPYKSFLFCTIADIPVTTVSDDIEELVKGKEGTVLSRNNLEPEGLEISLFTYIDKITPPWSNDESVKDIINELVVVVKKNKYIAIYSSNTSIRDTIRSFISGTKKKKENKFTYLKLIPRGLLNAAFIKGQTQTLWLSGTHRRTASKVDNKIINGLDLRYALDPLGDQSFFFTAARCKLPTNIFKNLIGISPRKSSLWAGFSKQWDDFIVSTKLLLNLLEDTKKPNQNPLPILAESINGLNDLENIGKCYDAAIIPPILLAETDIDSNDRKDAEMWNELHFEIVSTESSLNFKAEVSLFEIDKLNNIGTFSFTFDDLTMLPQVEYKIEGEAASSENQEIFNKALNMLQTNKNWLKVWYDSGHVIAEREIFLHRFRDMPFMHFEGQALINISIKNEKPPYPIEDNIGKHKSLFCYVKNTLTKGWLTCDDGSMEMADFIHFNKITDKPTISLIHVKASKKNEPKRNMAVSDYEIVVSQAIKNIRYLSTDNLLEGLTAGLKKKIQNATWKDGKKQSNGRKGMLKEIEKCGTNISYKVIVFQPRARISEIEKTRVNKKGKSYKILQQLDTLLLGASHDCQSAGAEFIAWIDGS
ncbi:MAG: hypothetical protein JW787_12735 [Sedimentisphaerales bacterium]|nr:hypothetical protein [Sedimentisphaerales bacterium]